MSVDVSTATREDVLAAQAIVDMLAGTGVDVEDSVKALAELDPMEVAPKGGADDSAVEASSNHNWLSVVHFEPGGPGEAAWIADMVARSRKVPGSSPSGIVALFADAAKRNREASETYHRFAAGGTLPEWLEPSREGHE